VLAHRMATFGAAGALAGILLVSACSATDVNSPSAARFISGAKEAPQPPETSAPKPEKPAMVNAMDRQFVTKASQANLEEVALGVLGQQKAQSESVKAFAKRMETDHSKAEQELMTAAEEAKLTPPTDLPPEAKATMERLKKLSGMAFDREYMKVMVMGHEKAIRLFTMEVEKGSHPALTGYAKTSLPTLKEHLSMAKSIQSQLK